jgi:hypothetical protein
MKTFIDIWQLLSPKAEYVNRMRACRELWDSLTENQQDNIFDLISDKLSKGKFVDYNPLFAIEKNAVAAKPQILSYDAYYAKYGTTEEQDGWQRVYEADKKRTIYVKQGC